MEVEFKTRDLTEAAYLFYLGFQYELDRRNPNAVVVIFRGDGELFTMKIRDLTEDRARVSARSFAIAIREIKRAIISQENYIPRFHRRRTMDSVQDPPECQT
jgi:hypothetical protein